MECHAETNQTNRHLSLDSPQKMRRRPLTIPIYQRYEVD